MTHLRRAIVVLLAYLTILYNIERLDLGKENLIDISSFVYVLTFLTTMAVIALPYLSRQRTAVLVALGLAIYAAGKFALAQGRPILGGIYTYLTIAEMALVGLGVIFSRELAAAIHDFEEAVQNITLAGVSRRIKRLDEASDMIEVELIRSRRHNRPLTITVIEPVEESVRATLHRTIQEVQQAMMARYVMTALARVIGSQLRRSDLIIDQHEQGRFIIFSSETKAEDSDILNERIRQAVDNQLQVALKIGRAGFPEQAVTFEELVHQAELKLAPPTRPLTAYESLPTKTNAESSQS